MSDSIACRLTITKMGYAAVNMESVMKHEMLEETRPQTQAIHNLKNVFNVWINEKKEKRKEWRESLASGNSFKAIKTHDVQSNDGRGKTKAIRAIWKKYFDRLREAGSTLCKFNDTSGQVFPQEGYRILISGQDAPINLVPIFRQKAYRIHIERQMRPTYSVSILIQ